MEFPDVFDAWWDMHAEKKGERFRSKRERTRAARIGRIGGAS